MEKEKETRECGGSCQMDEDRKKWAEGGQVGGCREVGGALELNNPSNCMEAF